MTPSALLRRSKPASAADQSSAPDKIPGDPAESESRIRRRFAFDRRRAHPGPPTITPAPGLGAESSPQPRARSLTIALAQPDREEIIPVAAECYWQPAAPSRWRWRAWPMLVPFIGCMLAVGTVTWQAAVPEFAPGIWDMPQFVRDRAAILWILCWLPAIRYTLRPSPARRPIPFLPIIGLLYGLYYALSPAMGLANYWSRDPVTGAGITAVFDPRRDYGHPINMALAGWIACLAGCWLPRGFVRRRPRFNRRLPTLGSRTTRRWAYAIAALGAATTFAQHSSWIPLNSAPARAVNLVAQAAIIILIVRDRRRLTSRSGKMLTWALVLATVFLDMGGGATARMLYIAFAIFMGLYTSRGALPVRYLIAGAFVLAACVAVRGVMTEWRHRVRWAGDGVVISATDQSRLLVELLRRSAETKGVGGTIADGWNVIARRSSNTELLADVMRRTPTEIPYWGGYTYRSLSGAFIPRIFWPDKPMKTLGQDFGHRYGYLGEDDLTTSFNLPVLVEFYANFGDGGIVLGMFLIGGFFALLEELLNRPGQSILVTAAAAPLVTQLFVMECDLSLQYGGLVMQFALFVAVARLLMLSDRAHRSPRRAQLHA